MMTKRVTIIEVKDYVGQEVTIGAWVANKSGKGKIKRINKAIYYDELVCCVSNYYRIDNSGGTNDSTSFNR